LFLAVTLPISGCSHTDEARIDGLPAGSDVLARSASAMASVRYLHFTLDAVGSSGNESVRHVEGNVSREGSAEGRATIDRSGVVSDIEFVIVAQSLYIKGEDGKYAELPLSLAAAVYDPSHLLGDSGFARLLRTATNARTMAREVIYGIDAFLIAFDSDDPALTAILPGLTTVRSGRVWVDAANYRIVQGEFTFPGLSGPVTLTIICTAYDIPVPIARPG